MCVSLYLCVCVRERQQRHQTLTALHGDGGGLQGQHLPAGLGDVHPEHHPHTRVLPADVRLALPQLDVRVAELQDARAVDAEEPESRTVRSSTTTRHQHLHPLAGARRRTVEVAQAWEL